MQMSKDSFSLLINHQNNSQTFSLADKLLLRLDLFLKNKPPSTICYDQGSTIWVHTELRAECGVCWRSQGESIVPYSKPAPFFSFQSLLLVECLSCSLFFPHGFLLGVEKELKMTDILPLSARSSLMFGKQKQRAWFRSFPHSEEGALVTAGNTGNMKNEVESSREVTREYL